MIVRTRGNVLGNGQMDYNGMELKIKYINREAPNYVINGIKGLRLIPLVLALRE